MDYADAMDPADISSKIMSDIIDAIVNVGKAELNEIFSQNAFESGDVKTHKVAAFDASDDECKSIETTSDSRNDVGASDSMASETILHEEEHSEIILVACEDEKTVKNCDAVQIILDVREEELDADADEIILDVCSDEPVACENGTSEINLQNSFDSSDVTTYEAASDASKDNCELIVSTTGAQPNSIESEAILDVEEHSEIILNVRRDEPITVEREIFDEVKNVGELIVSTTGVEDSKSTTSETILDEEKQSEIIVVTCEDEETVQKVGDAVQNTLDVRKEELIAHADEIILDVCSDAPIACDDEAREVILQILESWFNAVNASEATSDFTLASSEDKPSSDEKIALQIDKTNEMENQSLSYADFKSSDLESDTSLIVESIDCIYDKDIDRDMGFVAAIEATDFERSESGVSTNAVMSTPAEIIAQPCETEERNDKQRVDQNPDCDLDGQETLVTEDAATNNLSKPPANSECYSDEELRRKGYDIQCKGTVNRVVSLVLSADKLNKSTAYCSGFPHDVSANKLIPLFERFGRVFELIVVQDTGVINVTYMTDKECECAINALNGRKIRGNAIKVENYCKRTRLHVTPISINAKKHDLVVQFNRLTKGLVDLILPHSDYRQNRGYCYLDYKNTASAREAKNILCAMKYNGRKVICDWAEVQPDHCKQHVEAIEAKRWRKVFTKNLRPGMTAANLRTLFSVYGEVTEIDKNDNWASVKFRDPNEAKWALRNIDRNLLGNENVEIFQNLENSFRQGDSGYRASISNNNSFGAARPGSPKSGSNERYSNRQSPKLGFDNRRNIGNDNVGLSERSGNRQDCSRIDSKSMKNGTIERYGPTSTFGPATADINSTLTNDPCGAIDANATAINKPVKSDDQIWFL